MEVALEAGAEDVVSEDGGFTVKCQPNDFTSVLEAIKAGGINVDEENSSVGLVPNMMNPVNDVATAKAINKFVDMLEDLEDVQDVYTNMETSDEVDAALEAINSVKNGRKGSGIFPGPFCRNDSLFWYNTLVKRKGKRDGGKNQIFKNIRFVARSG